jgi:farnesyl-diphosphate farnesyltransferase
MAGWHDGEVMPPLASQPALPVADPELFGRLLAAVSRSFSLTIRALPCGVRRPVALAYLLARMSDTVADSASAPATVRLALLRALDEAVAGRGECPELEALEVSNAAERRLLGQATVLLRLLQECTPADRALIQTLLAEIIKGQMLDLERFGERQGDGFRALESDAALDDYTYRVAGCVGAFWTRICLAHESGDARYARLDAAEMVRLGVLFGKGLQLVNILRDIPEDRRNGRCYLPVESEEEIPAAFSRWLAVAREQLQAGLLYLEAVRPWRIRLACFLPWALGVLTLERIEAVPPWSTAQRVKVSRATVRWLLGWGVLCALSNGVLRYFTSRLLTSKK